MQTGGFDAGPQGTLLYSRHRRDELRGNLQEAEVEQDPAMTARTTIGLEMNKNISTTPYEDFVFPG